MAHAMRAIALLVAALMLVGVSPAAAWDCLTNTQPAPTCLAGYVFDSTLIGTGVGTACSSSTTTCTGNGNAPTSGISECCKPLTYTCGSDAASTVCNQGFYFKPDGTYSTANQNTCAITTLISASAPTGCVKSGTAQCCYQKMCSTVDAVGNTFCPYGYQLKLTHNSVGNTAAPLDRNINTALTVETCCERLSTVLGSNDVTNAAFPICMSTNSGGISTGVQASTQDDTNWRLQDENSFLRTVDIYQGMCFSVTIENDCSEAEANIKGTCCTKKVPSYVQFKIPTDTGVTTDDGIQIANARSNTLRSDNLRKCALRYGRHITPARSFKPINRWLTVPAVSANTPDARFVNIPITFGRGAKQATVCIYTNSFKNAQGNVDCSWESLCGYGADGNVPTDAGSYLKGCEIRVVGRNTPTSTPCCSPTYSIESVDFFPASSNSTAIKPFKVITN